MRDLKRVRRELAERLYAEGEDAKQLESLTPPGNDPGEMERFRSFG